MQSLLDHQNRGADRCSDGNSLKVTQKEAGQAGQRPWSCLLWHLQVWGGRNSALAQHSLCEPLSRMLIYWEVKGLLPSLCYQLPVVPLKWQKSETTWIWIIYFCFFPDSVPRRYKVSFSWRNDLIFPWFLLGRAGMETSTFRLPGSS